MSRFPFISALACALLVLAGCATTSEAVAAGKPTAITLTCTASVVEGSSATCTASKSGGNGRPVAATWSTDTGQSGKLTLGSSPVGFPVATVDDTIVNGTRVVTVTAVSSTARASTTFAITDNDVAPPPPPVICPDGSTVPAGTTCPPVVVPPPAGPLVKGELAVITKTCSDLRRDETPPIGATFTVETFGAQSQLGADGNLGQPIAGTEFVVLSDQVAHQSDGWKALYLPIDCAAGTGQPAP